MRIARQRSYCVLDQEDTHAGLTQVGMDVLDFFVG